MSTIGWKESAIALAVEGITWRQIAIELDVPKSTVSDHLRKHFKGYVRPVEREWNEARSTGPVIYSFDIETAPMKGYFFGIWNQNISFRHIEQDWFILSYVAQRIVNNEGAEISYDALGLYDEYEGQQNDAVEYQLVENLWHMLDEADIVVAHNGWRFDRKKVNTRFLYHGFPEPSPYKVVDTLKIAKSKFGFTSNSLDYITQFLDNKGKLATNMQLWIDCLNNCPVAWNNMVEYNKRDVTELTDVYLKLRHWDGQSPNMALYYDDDKVRCVGCGSENLVLEEKSARTGVSVFETLRCVDCGKLNRGRKNTRSKEANKATLTNVAN